MEQVWKITKDILLPLIVGGIIWLISVTNDNRTEILLLQHDVEQLAESHYSPKDARVLETQLTELNRRLDRIEKILNAK